MIKADIGDLSVPDIQNFERGNTRGMLERGIGDVRPRTFSFFRSSSP